MASILDMINRQRDIDYNLQLAKAQEDRELERQLEAEQRRLENQMKLYEARTGRTSQPTATEETPTDPQTFYDVFSEGLYNTIIQNPQEGMEIIEKMLRDGTVETSQGEVNLSGLVDIQDLARMANDAWTKAGLPSSTIQQLYQNIQATPKAEGTGIFSRIGSWWDRLGDGKRATERDTPIEPMQQKRPITESLMEKDLATRGVESVRAGFQALGRSKPVMTDLPAGGYSPDLAPNFYNFGGRTTRPAQGRGIMSRIGQSGYQQQDIMGGTAPMEAIRPQNNMRRGFGQDYLLNQFQQNMFRGNPEVATSENVFSLNENLPQERPQGNGSMVQYQGQEKPLNAKMNRYSDTGTRKQYNTNKMDTQERDLIDLWNTKKKVNNFRTY